MHKLPWVQESTQDGQSVEEDEQTGAGNWFWESPIQHEGGQRSLLPKCGPARVVRICLSTHSLEMPR